MWHFYVTFLCAMCKGEAEHLWLANTQIPAKETLSTKARALHTFRKGQWKHLHILTSSIIKSGKRCMAYNHAINAVVCMNLALYKMRIMLVRIFSFQCYQRYFKAGSKCLFVLWTHIMARHGHNKMSHNKLRVKWKPHWHKTIEKKLTNKEVYKHLPVLGKKIWPPGELSLGLLWSHLACICETSI